MGFAKPFVKFSSLTLVTTLTRYPPPLQHTFNTPSSSSQDVNNDTPSPHPYPPLRLMSGSLRCALPDPSTLVHSCPRSAPSVHFRAASYCILYYLLGSSQASVNEIVFAIMVFDCKSWILILISDCKRVNVKLTSDFKWRIPILIFRNSGHAISIISSGWNISGLTPVQGIQDLAIWLYRGGDLVPRLPICSRLARRGLINSDRPDGHKSGHLWE